jgi:hypothetical protein
LYGDFEGQFSVSFVTEGGRQGIALPILLALIDRRTGANALGYFQVSGVADDAAARQAPRRARLRQACDQLSQA